MLAALKLLIPAVIPSWRFFDAVRPSPRIEIARISDGKRGPWQEFRPRPPHVSGARMFWRMVHNPHWNAGLFLVSLAERLITAPSSHCEAEIIARIRHDLGPGAFQFRVVFIHRDGQDLRREVLFGPKSHPGP